MHEQPVRQRRAAARGLERRAPSALQRLIKRATELRKANSSDAVLVLDASGEAVAREFPVDRAVAVQLRETAVRAMASGEVMHTGIYRRDGTEPPLRLDIVLPLVGTGEPARGALVLRLDPRRQLFPTLRAWPVPSASGETVLWRREGDLLQAVSEFRHRADMAMRLTQPQQLRHALDA